MKKTVRKTESGYPLMRYLSLLLVVALLFSGVTFARYALSRNESVNTGIAKYDASYTIDGVNSVAFGNSSYWMDIAGAWYEQGSARTVRVKMQNNSDVNVRAKTLHMEGPADFWENIALQLMTAKDDGTAENIITTQYVLADFLREKTGGSKDNHDIKYGGYKSWGENESFDTATSDEFGQRDNVEENLTVTGGIKDESGNVSGSVIITRGENTYGGGGEAYIEENASLTITITASMEKVEYSVGFARKQANNLSMPAFYLDCVKTVPYYSIDITLPETDHFNMTTAENDKTTSVIAFLTWTNSDPSEELKQSIAPSDLAALANGTNTSGFCGATVIGYHFNYNDVPTTEGETTTVRMNKATNGTITWQHIASLSEAEAEDPDGVYAHDIVDENGDPVKWKVSETLSGTYSCRGQTPGTSGGAVSFSAETLMGLKGDFSSEEFVKADSQDNCTASEKGYAVSFSVYFEQSSELPPSGASTP